MSSSRQVRVVQNDQGSSLPPGGEPNAANRSRIRTLLRLVVQSRVSASDPLFPRFVKPALGPGNRILLDLLSEETIDEATAGNLTRIASARTRP